MASNYPGSLDSFDTIASDKKTSDSVGGRTHRAMHNDLGDAIEAVQTELGANPSGSESTVVARLEKIEDGTRLANDAVDTAAIQDGAVTFGKLGSPLAGIIKSTGTGREYPGDSYYKAGSWRDLGQAYLGGSSTGAVAIALPIPASNAYAYRINLDISLASNTPTGNSLGLAVSGYFNSGHYGARVHVTHGTLPSWLTVSVGKVTATDQCVIVLGGVSTTWAYGNIAATEAHFSYHVGAATMSPVVFTTAVTDLSAYTLAAALVPSAALARRGIGSPEAAITGNPGEAWIQTDTASPVGWTEWRKQLGVGNTGWAPVPLAVEQIILPTDISAVVGDTLQVFYDGIVEHPNPAVLPIRAVSAKGTTLPRMWEFTPSAGDVGTASLTVSVTDADQNVRATGAVNVVVKAAANPAALKTIMCVGDSLTVDMKWPQEAYRRLTQSGGTPAGHGFANYDFVGDRAFTSYPTQGGFGEGGWTWGTWIGATSPFWIGGEFDIKAWFDANNGGVGPDMAIILLGWNEMVSSSLPSDHSSVVADAKTFLDKLHTQYPSCKVTLIGLQAPSPLGGLGTNYGATAALCQRYDLVRWSNARNLAIKSISAEAGYSSWVRWASLSAQFDAAHSYPSTTVAANVRSATTESRQTNGVHPSDEGQMQIADVAYREVVRWLS